MITPEIRQEISELPEHLRLDAWKSVFMVNPFDMIREGMLYIVSDRQKLIRLVPNNVQLEVLDYVEWCWKNDKPCYLVIPKARRTGISTIIEAIIYVLTIQGNTKAIIIADEKKNSKNILQMTKTYHKYLSYYFKPEADRHRGEDLYWNDINSQIIIDTAEKRETGSSWGFQLIHLSEVARFSFAETLVAELFQTLPDNMFVLVALESTGRGIGGYFYDVVRASEKGDNNYKLMFFAWYQKKENTMNISENEEFILMDSGKYGNEILIKERYNLADEQIRWRRFAIDNKCNGNLKTFKEKHPSTIDECFQASGVNAFDVEKLNVIEKETKKYRWRGILVERGGRGGRVEFKEDVNGWLDIWEKPELGWDNRYNLSLDTGGKSEKADYSDGIVRCNLSKQDVAQYHFHAPAHITAKKSILVGKYYGGCQITPEINKWVNEIDDEGEPVLNYLRDNYNNIYQRKTYDTNVKDWTNKLGFHTNKQTKKLIIHKINEVIDEFFELGEHINDIEIVKEMKMYIEDERKGTFEATAGEKDDRVMSWGINLVTSAEMPEPRLRNKTNIKKHISHRDVSQYV